MQDETLDGRAKQIEPPRRYRAITRQTDNRIIYVRDFEARNDAEAILIVTARGVEIQTDLWSDEGLVQRFEANSA